MATNGRSWESRKNRQPQNNGPVVEETAFWRLPFRSAVAERLQGRALLEPIRKLRVRFESGYGE